MPTDRWPTVRRFAAVMRAKLDENADRPGWEDAPTPWLLKRLREELDELERALAVHRAASDRERPGTTRAVVDEAADVANFAMMIADVVGRLRDAR